VVQVVAGGHPVTARTLYLDIETAPHVAHVWGLWQQTVSLSQLQEASRVLCFAAKWRGKNTQFYAEWDDGGTAVMLEKAHGLLSAADVVVHYNGQSFDIPTLNKEFILAGMLPPAPYHQVDLYRAAKKKFRFASNKLAYVSTALGLQGKTAHEGHAMWVKVLAGDAKARAHMGRYCRQDTALLEPLHDRLMPWITNAPNARLLGDGQGCPDCGVTLLAREGYAILTTGKYQRYRCLSCGAWSRGTSRVDGTDVRPVA
jgi:RNase_H superfamily